MHLRWNTSDWDANVETTCGKTKLLCICSVLSITEPHDVSHQRAEIEQSCHLAIALQICLVLLEGRIQFPNLQAAHLKHTFPLGTHTTCSLCFPGTQTRFILVRQRLRIFHYKLVTCPRFPFATQISLWNFGFIVLLVPHAKCNLSTKTKFIFKNLILVFFWNIWSIIAPF